MGVGRRPNAFHILLFVGRSQGAASPHSPISVGQLHNQLAENINDRILLICIALRRVATLKLVWERN